MNTVKISFSGKMGSGKDTMGKCFSKAFPNALHLSFAEVLRQEVADTLQEMKENKDYKKPEEMPDELFELLKKKSLEEGVSPYERTDEMRTILQLFGDDYRRGIDTNYWVKSVEELINKYKDTKPMYVTDARYYNELDMLKEHGFYLVLLDIPEQERINRIHKRDGKKPKEENLNHSSESQVLFYEAYDCIVTEEELNAQDGFHEIMEEYRHFKEMN